MILYCSVAACQTSTALAAKFQDKTYGKGMRVHNPKASGKTGDKSAGCVICGNFRGYTDKDLK